MTNPQEAGSPQDQGSSQDPYPQGAYQQGAHQQGAHQQGPYQQGAHQQGPYQQGAYQQGPPGYTPPQQFPPMPAEQPAPFGLPGGPPLQRSRQRSRRKLWIILGSIGGVLLLVIIGIVILVNIVGSATNQARGLADDFTKKVIAGDTSGAYDEYLDPALQEQLSKEAFISGVQSLEMDGSCQPSYNNLKVATENGVKSAEVVGQISCTGKKVDLAYKFEGTDQLRMTNIKLRPAS